MCVLSLVAIVLLFIAKKPVMKQVMLYVTALFGIVIAWLNVTSEPSNFLMQRGIAAGIGLLAVVGIVVWHVSKGRQETAAKALVTASVVLGIATLFF